MQRMAYTDFMLQKDIQHMLERHVPSSHVGLIEHMKFFIEPEISCSRFFAETCFTNDSLQEYRRRLDVSALRRTELGEFLKERMIGSMFIDVPCGLYAVRETGKDYDLIPLVQTLGASSYIEVDLTSEVLRDRLSVTIDVLEGGRYRLAKNIGEIGSREERGLAVATIQDDLLGFISKLPDAKDHPPLTIYIAALQPDVTFCSDAKNQHNIIVPYLMALYHELARVCGADDTLVLNSAEMLVSGINQKIVPEIHPAIALFQRGFTLERRCKYDKMQVYVH